MVKRLGVAQTIGKCLSGDTSGWGWGSKNFNPSQLLDFTNDVEPFLSKDISVRAEGSIFSIYCSDEALFNSMCKKLKHWIECIYIPATDAEQTFLLDNKHKKIICNHLPFDTYHYRVNLKSTLSDNVRESFYKWMSNYDGKIQAPSSTLNWLSGTMRWAVNPNFYVKDGPTLAMVGLFLGDRISSVQEFVPRSMINTLSKEQPCPV